MKALTNVAKAKLLHELFPDEIPGLLDHLLSVCADLKENKEAYEKTWDFGLMSFNRWLNLAQQAAAIIKKQRPAIIKSSRAFSEQLFHSFDYTVLFVNNRIVKYALNVSADEKFKQAVALLFHI